MVIALCGYMGSGKSTIGEKLAYKLKYNYLDTDNLCEIQAQMTVKDIFEKFGEIYFRDLESEVISLLKVNQNLILSLGGGSLIKDKNIDIIKSKAKIIFLNTSFEVCYNRITKNNKRPIVNALTKNELIEHYKQRVVNYEKSADYIVDGDSENVLENILKLIKL